MASSSSTTTTHYALVEAGETLYFERSDETPRRKDDDVREALTQIYETYAQLYPNPSLVTEQLERDRLLQQVRAELIEEEKKRKEAEELSAVDSQKKKSGGFFGFLFGSKKRKDSHDDLDVEVNEDDYLEYSDIADKDEWQKEKDTFCGTASLLETSCIPPEAHFVARFHLTSSIRSQPLLVRDATPSPMVILDLGVMAQQGQDGRWCLMETSDRQELMAYKSSIVSSSYSVSHIRAVAIRQDLVAVSWGFADGHVVLYRLTRDRWEPQAMMAPTAAVLQNLQDAQGDVFLQHADDGSTLSSQSLRVAALLPLVVDPGAVTLVIARLGGYLEFIPLDSQLWLGPPIKQQRRRAPRRGVVPHYCAGHLYNLSSHEEDRIAALTTLEHHSDIQTLEAVRTSVTSDTVWDAEAFPDAPPAEFLLVATGSSSQSFVAEEVVTFWSVATVVSDHPEAEPNDYSLHVTFLHSLTLPTSPGTALFVNDVIWQHWRRQRHVALRERGQETTTTSSSTSVDEHARPSKKLRRSGMLSTPAPIVGMAFSVNSETGAVHLALLDHPGGVTVVDCTLLYRWATQSLAQQDVQMLNESHPPVQITWSRSQIAQLTKYMGRRHDVQWLKPNYLLLLATDGIHFISTQDSGSLLSKLSLRSTCGGAFHIDYLNDNQRVSLVMADREDANPISCCTLEALEPSAMIQRLARAQKYEEALSAAEGMSDDPIVTQVIDLCHKKLWEEKRSLEDLSRVSNEEYIVNQVLRLVDNEGPALDVSLAREACRLAMDKLGSARLAKVVEIGGSQQGFNSLVGQLKDLYIRLGTYVALCQIYGCEPASFRESFSNIELLDLAKSMAAKGDLRSLTVVVFRHAKELANVQELILNELPLPLDPLSYCHLLPVTARSSSFFSPDAQGLLGWMAMNQYVQQSQGWPSMLMNGEDLNVFDIQLDERDDSTQVSRWYSDRSVKMQQFAANIPSLLTFCDMAMKCIGQTDDPFYQEIESTKLCGQFLDELLLSRVDMSDEAPTVTVSEMKQLSVDQLISFVLGQPKDSGEVLHRFKTYVQPILSLPGMRKVKDEDGDGNVDGVDEAIAKYCVSLIWTDMPDSTKSQYERITSLRNALSIVASLAGASKTTLSKSKRLIKNKDLLIDLFLKVVDGISKVSMDLNLMPSDSRFLLDRLWDLYECLPDQPTPDDAMSNVHDQVDTIYRHLVAVDLASRWAHQCLPVLQRLEVSRTNQDQFLTVGRDLISLCCEGLGTRKFDESNVESNMNQLLDLLSDVERLNAACFAGSIETEPTLKETLVKTLLKNGHISLLSNLLSVARPYWADDPSVHGLVVSFVDDALFGDSSPTCSPSTNKFDVAIQCQDILGPQFPELLDSFRSMRGHLDAASFMRSVLLKDAGFGLSPTDIRDMPPIDVIEYVLRENPRSMLEGCAEWAEPEYAWKALSGLRLFFGSQTQPSEVELPRVPGGSILHLAGMVGLSSVDTLVLVKSRIAHHAMESRMPWVAAAIALDVVAAEPFENGPDSAIRLALAANVVSCEQYTDWATKKALCQHALCKFRGRATHNHQPHMDRILDVWPLVETHTSRFHPEALRQAETKLSSNATQKRSEASDFLVFRAAGAVASMVGSSLSRDEAEGARQSMPRSIDRVYMDTLNGYSTDLHELFSILKMKAKNLERDDPLLLALSRFQLFWLIACATRLSPEDMDGSQEQADARNTLALTTSLLYHVQDMGGLASFVAELGEITEGQIANAMNTLAINAKPETPRADLGIVRLLRERGFTENGARRAAAMTNNESVEIALNWAIAHVADPGFDNPIVLVKSLDDLYGDRKLMVDLKSLLVRLSDITEGKQTSRLPNWERKSSLLMTEEASSREVAQSTTSEKAAAAERAIPTTSETKSTTVNGEERCRNPTRPKGAHTVPSEPPEPNERSALTTSTRKSAEAIQAASASRSIVVEEPTSTLPPMIQARRQAAEAKKQADVQAQKTPSPLSKKSPPTSMPKITPTPPSSKKIPTPPSSLPKKTTPPPPPPRRAQVRPTPAPPPRSGDRSTLLQKGQQVRQQQRRVMQLNSAERKRFMSKARALVTRARSPTRSRRDLPIQAPRSAPLPISKPPSKATPEKEDAASDGWDFDDF